MRNSNKSDNKKVLIALNKKRKSSIFSTKVNNQINQIGFFYSSIKIKAVDLKKFLSFDEHMESC